MKTRCLWCVKSQLEMDYHDTEWGVPLHDDKKFFEFLVLDAAQAGLSWATVLKKREGYREAFDNYNYEKIANYNETKIQELLQNEKIIRNKLKINSAVYNAQAFLKVQKEFGSFDAYVWRFVDGKPVVNGVKTLGEIQATSKESDAMSKDMKKRGFKFVGSTICYAFMQASGLVNDHTTDCFRFPEVQKL
ncbi:DNA-3-methyladenine glycosylase I [bacterium]|nr:DNA-3-methyladenine glycosylase I [bacterium]